MTANNPKIVSQHIDTLKTSHRAISEEQLINYRKNLVTLEKYKIQAQSITGVENNNRFVVADLFSMGTFKIFAQGAGVYRYRVENDDFRVLLGDIKLDSDRTQIVVTYNQSFLVTLGHLRAYSLVKSFLNRIIGSTKDYVTEIHLATDVMGVRYDHNDLMRFQTNFKRSEFMKNGVLSDDCFTTQLVAKSSLETITLGRNSFMFRIYDKTKELRKKISDKAILLPRWIMNGYDDTKKISVWRHEIQLRDTHLKKHFPTDCENQVIYAFNNLGSIWAYLFSRVSYTPLNDNEIARVQNSTNSNTIKMIFYRAKKENRLNYFDIIKSWDNKIASTGLDYSGIKEAKIKSAHRSAKSFVSSVYRAYGANPSNISQVLADVSSELCKYDSVTLHEYASLKLVDSFIKNEFIINRVGVKPPSFHTTDFFKAQNAFFDVLRTIRDEKCSIIKSKTKYDILKVS